MHTFNPSTQEAEASLVYRVLWYQNINTQWVLRRPGLHRETFSQKKKKKTKKTKKERKHKVWGVPCNSVVRHTGFVSPRPWARSPVKMRERVEDQWISLILVLWKETKNKQQSWSGLLFSIASEPCFTLYESDFVQAGWTPLVHPPGKEKQACPQDAWHKVPKHSASRMELTSVTHWLLGRI